MHHGLTFVFRLGILIVFIVGLAFQPQSIASAAASLSVTPITWNIIGLDSNNVNVGPNHFPVGARVCNTGDAVASNIKSSFVWDSNDPYISLRAGTLTSFTDNGINLDPGECTDFYYEVEVLRNSAAYRHLRRYHITASADGGLTGSTPTPRELFVEYLVSQNRNAVSDVKLNGTSIPSGGTMSLVVGNTYTIQLVGSTATQGYEQIESFINFPNTIFQVLSVNTTYTAETSADISPPYDGLYGDACRWENDPNSPNYRGCNGVGKAGGTITVTYQIKILQAPSTPLVNPSPLSTLIYDFSGSSYHYNADYGVSTRYAYVFDPSAVTISKNFNPDPTTVSGISTLTFTLTNPAPVTVTSLNFSDTLPTTPGAMTVAGTPNASTTGCGSPTFAPTAGAASLSFSNGSLAPNSSCTIKVNVTVPVAGTYNNTSSNLFIGALDTGNNATDTLTVNNAPAGPAPVCGLTMAQWTFAGFTANPPPFPAASTKAANVATAAISVGNGLTAEADTTASGGNPQPGIRTYGWQNAAPITAATSAFIQFAIDTSKYTQVAMQFDAQRKANGPSNDELYYSTDGTNWSPKSVFSSSTSWATYGAYSFTGQASTTGITYFRIYGYGANATSSGNDMNLDNVTFTGCGTPSSPAISKTFFPNPVAVGATSTLTFTLANPNSGMALSGISFTDTLPGGLTVTTGSSSQCGGTLSTTALQAISFSGGSLAANASCTINVTVTATASGVYDNVSGFISSTEGGTNSGAAGIATASLTVLKPPSMAKLFAPNPILTNGTSTLTFTITNPNLNNALTGISFSDTYPPGVVNTNPSTTTNSCGGSVIAVAGANNVSLSGGTVAAGGTCTVTVNNTASTVGSYANTSGAVSSTNGGTGNMASDTLTVNAPNPAIALLKQVSTSLSGPWTSYVTVDAGSNVYYRFMTENIGDVPLNPVVVADPGVNTGGCTWPAPLPVAVSGNDNHIATCVVGPVAAVSGSNINTATVSGTYGGIPYQSTSSSATYATPGLTLVKSVTENSFAAAGDFLHYSYLVTNSGFAPLLGPVTVTDDKATVTCPAISTIGDNDNYLDPAENVTCTATYTVAAADVIAGFVTNIASAAASGVTSNSDTQTVTIFRPDLTIAKTNNVSDSVPQNGTFNWTISVGNSGIAAATFSDTNIIMNDTLPGAAAYYPQGLLTVTNGATPATGTIDCSITGTALTCAANGAVTLPAGSSFSVTFAVSPTVAGSLANTATVDPNGNITEINETNNSSTNTVTVLTVFDAQPSKSIVATSESSTGLVAGTERVLIGEMIRYRLVSRIPEGSFTNVQLLDGLPNGLQFLNDNTATVALVCNGGAACMTSSTLSGAGLVVSGAGGNISPTFAMPGYAISSAPFGTATNITFSLGDIGNVAVADSDSEYVVVEFNALVLNVNSSVTINQGTNNQTGENSTNNRQNDVTLFVNGVMIGSASPNATVSIAEPAITSITKSVLPAGPYLPGDSLTYSLSFGNTTFGNTNAATAFDIVLTDTFDANLAPGAVNVTSTQGASCAGGTAFTTDNFTSGQLLTVNISCLDPGKTVTVTVDAIIAGTTSSGTTVINSSGLTYTSLPGTQGNCSVAPFTCTGLGTSGSGTGERGGWGGPGADGTVLNNYAAMSNTVNTRVDYGSLTITKNAVPDGSQDFGFTGSGPNGYDFGSGFSLDDDIDGTLPNTQTFTLLVPGTFTVTEESVAGWSLTGLTCVDPDNGSSTDLGTATAIIDLDAGESIGCTYTNTQLKASVGLTKTPATQVVASGGTASFTLAVTNTGNVTLTGVSVADAQCTAGPTFIGGDTNNDSQLQTTETWTYSCSISNVVTDFTNTASVSTTQGATNSDSAEVTMALAPAINVVKGSATTSITAAGQVVPYSFTVTNTGNVTLTGLTVSDAMCATMPILQSGDTNNDSQLQMAETWVYTCTHTVNQAEVDAGGNLSNTVTVDSIESGPDTDTFNIPVAQDPTVAIVKSSDATGAVAVNDVISYTYDVENTGTVTLTDVTVTDDHIDLGLISCTPAQGSSLLPGETMSCAAIYTVKQADIDAGKIDNTGVVTAAPPTGSNVTDNDFLSEPLAQAPSLTIVKEVAASTTGPWNDTGITVTIGDTVYYQVRVANTGNVTLTGLTVDDGMPGCTLIRVMDNTGNNDSAFEVGEEWVYNCSITAVSGLNNNTATADTNETPSDSDTASYTASAALVVDPAISKAGSPTQASVGETVTFTLVVTNQGTAPAPNVVVTDVLPSMFDVTAVNVNGAPLGTLINVTPPIGTGTPPHTVIATLGGDLAVTDVVTIQIVTRVNSLGNPPVTNTASLTTSALTDVIANNSDSVTIGVRSSGTVSPSLLPATGFAKDVDTMLEPQPVDLLFANTDLVLEIPSLRVSIPIVGVPKKNGSWNVSWLGDQAGWLEGSAFPSWNGNSVLTSHVYAANGLPGPFVNLNRMKFGDRIIVHAYGQKYTFEVQTNTVVLPNDKSVMKHEDKPWLTLVTCKDYDEKTNTYSKRVIVRAVLVSVAWE